MTNQIGTWLDRYELTDRRPEFESVTEDAVWMIEDMAFGNPKLVRYDLRA